MAWPITPFEVDTHRSQITEQELALIRRHFHVPDYVKFHLPEPTEVLTRPPPGCVAVYRDFFIRGF